MDTPFTYCAPVTGKNFIGRKADINALTNLISNGENIAIYSAPKAGKTSLLQQTLIALRTSGHIFVTTEVDLLDIRTCSAFAVRLADAIVKAFGTTPMEYSEIISTYLANTHFCFDERQYLEKGQIVSTNWEPDMKDLKAALRLGDLISSSRSQKLVVFLKEFHSVSSFDNSFEVIKVMEEILAETSGRPEHSCSFVMTGSRLNAMKDLFEVHKYFFHTVVPYEMTKIDEKDIIEYIVRGLLSSGKVVDNEILLGVCKLFRNDMWHINHFISICDHLSKGYIMEHTLTDALNMQISLHRPAFVSAIDDLTTFQIGLLHAIIDGHSKFSTSEVIQSYALNSSANVKRLKDALIKKEIITFNPSDDPVIINPLFEYWLRKEYFKTDYRI